MFECGAYLRLTTGRQCVVVWQVGYIWGTGATNRGNDEWVMGRSHGFYLCVREKILFFMWHPEMCYFIYLTGVIQRYPFLMICV